jgi:PPOX class probable F420-dependent enzyme
MNSVTAAAPPAAPPAGRQHREEAAGGSYFAPLAQGRYFLLTTPRPKGAPVSARVPGIADGDRAYVRLWSGSGLAKRLRHADRIQVAACGGLGLLSYGEPMYAAVRPLASQEATRAAGKLAAKYPGQRDFLARVLRRGPVYYELLVP